MNAHAAYWILSRPAIGPGLINTKMNPIKLEDYGDADGLRGPAFTYGWIQGRGLEALAMAWQAMSQVPEHAVFSRQFGRGPEVVLDKSYHLVPVGVAAVIACGGGRLLLCET